MLRDFPTQENKLFLAAERARAKSIAHPPLRDHLTRKTSRVLEVVLWAGRALAEYKLLSDETAQARRKTVYELATTVEVAVFLGQKTSETSGHTARDDADLVRRVGVRQDVANQGVSSLMVGDNLLLFLANNATLALWPRDHPVHRLIELRHLDFLLTAARSENSAFIDQVRQVRP